MTVGVRSPVGLVGVFVGSHMSKPELSTTPVKAMGCLQCLPLSVVQLRGKHYRKPHCRNGVVDTFGLIVQAVLCLHGSLTNRFSKQNSKIWYVVSVSVLLR